MTDQYVEYGKSTLTVKNDRVLVYEFIVETAQHTAFLIRDINLEFYGRVAKLNPAKIYRAS